MKKFVLKVKYGTGTAAMIVNTPDLVEAINRFKKEYEKQLPDSKYYGLPDILKAELIPIMYESIYEVNDGN